MELEPGIKFARVRGFATIIARGSNPFIAEITAVGGKYRYERTFVGVKQRIAHGLGGTPALNEVSLKLTYMALPKLFEIRADGQDFYCIYQSGNESTFGIYPIDELVLRELLQAREFAKDFDAGVAAKIGVPAKPKPVQVLQSGGRRIISFDD
jgi:hypothetical protein